MKVFFQKFNEFFKLGIYDSKDKLLNFTAVITVFAAIFSIGIILYYHGFPLQPEQQELLHNLLLANISVFIINFILRFLFSFVKKDFLKSFWFEGFLIFFLLIDITMNFSAGEGFFARIFIALGFPDYASYLTFFMQSYILVLSMIEIIKLIRYVLSFRINPGGAFIGSFIIIILLGTTLLTFPEMTVSDEGISKTDAFFTAVSATTVTGLVVVDTGSTFTVKGQFIIMLLIQIGAIGVISFASFFVYFMKKGIGIRQQTALREYLNEENLSNTKNLLKKIIKYTLVIEGIGFVCMYFLWGDAVEFSSRSEKLFYTAFHTISAFCNAGFALFEDSLMTGKLEQAYVLHIIFAILIFFGSLGFPAIRDLFGIDNLRERMRKPWKGWKTSTYVAVYTSIGLIIITSVLYFLLEYNNTLQDKSFLEGLITSTFQAISGRTAGFSTSDTGALSTPVIFVLLLNMFIGGSSGSMAGGIKTSTAFILVLGVFTFLRGKKKLEFKKRTISYDLLNRAISVFFFGVIIVLSGTFLLTITEPDKDFLSILFETISATSIVGMSMGITADLSLAGKYVIIACMFIGRVGPLTIAFSLLSPVKESLHKYPNTHMMVG